VPAIKGTKIYLNDTLSSREDSAVIAYFGDSGVLVLGQNQQVPFTSDFFNNVDSLEQVASAQPDAGIDLAALELAIQAGQNIEELLEPTAAGGDSANESGAASSVVFYQRTGDSLISVPGIDSTTFSSVQSQPVFALGDIDANNQLNGISPLESVPEFVNTAPVATGDTAIASEDAILNVAANGVLTNDTDLDATDNVTVTAFDAVSANGAAVNVNTDGSYSYDPRSVAALNDLDLGETATDSFTYTIGDGNGGTSKATVTIKVEGSNDGLTATANTYTTDEDTTIIGNLMDDGIDDSDPSLPAGSILATDESKLTLQFNASNDTDGNDQWENASNTPPSASHVWDFGREISPIDVMSSFKGIEKAYSFNANAGDSTGARFVNSSGQSRSFDELSPSPSSNSATFELLFKSSDNDGHEVLFETGATTHGTSIRLNDSTIEFFVRYNKTEEVKLSFDLETVGIDPSAEFVQVAGVINTNSGIVELYVNGALAAKDDSGVIERWAGSDDAGLGTTNGTLNFDGSVVTPFQGEISHFNFYESALNSSNILTNFQAIAGFNVTEVNDTAISLNTPIALTHGSIIIAGDGSYAYTPNTDAYGVEEFTYTIVNKGETDTNTVIINVSPVNDGPVVESKTITVDEDSNDTSLGLTAPVDLEGDAFVIMVTGLPNVGTITLANGDAITNNQELSVVQLTGLRYDAPADYNGIDNVGAFTYTADDGQGLAGSVQTGIVAINVNPIADPITATDDIYMTDVGTSVVGNIITNTFIEGKDIDADPTVKNPIDNNLTLRFGASQDQGGNDKWVSTKTNDFDWDFNSTGAPGSYSSQVVSSSFAGISQAYSFNVNAVDSTGAVLSDGSGSGDSFQNMPGNPTNNSATFELWFKAKDTNDHDVLFESGAGGDGISIRINETDVEFFVKNSNGNNNAEVKLSFDLATIGIDPTDEFVQVAGVVNIGGDVELYINGALAAKELGAITDWDGSDDAGLGATQGGINFDSVSPFEGEIAIFNFYESALSSADVASNFQSVAGISVTEVNSSPVSLNIPIKLDSGGSLIIAADGSYQYTPDSTFNGKESFTYTLESSTGATDTAEVSIYVGDGFVTGDASDNIVFGSAANDILTGDDGADTFLFTVKDAANSEYTIADFSSADGDSLNFADLLQGENSSDATDLAKYLNVSSDGTDSTIIVDADGDGSGTDLTVVLKDVDLTQGFDPSGAGVDQDALLQSLINNNHLIVDSM
jgi:VCBS repeat-containing protein